MTGMGCLGGFDAHSRWCGRERVVVVAELPCLELRSHIDGNKHVAAVALPQLDVQRLEPVWLARAVGADRGACTDVLRAGSVQGGADRNDRLEVRVVRRPSIAVGDDDSEAVTKSPGLRDLHTV